MRIRTHRKTHILLGGQKRTTTALAHSVSIIRTSWGWFGISKYSASGLSSVRNFLTGKYFLQAQESETLYPKVPIFGRDGESMNRVKARAMTLTALRWINPLGPLIWLNAKTENPSTII